MIVYDNGRVKVITQPSQVYIMTEDWQRIYITYDELADIGEAVAAYLELPATEYIDAAGGPLFTIGDIAAGHQAIAKYIAALPKGDT